VTCPLCHFGESRGEGPFGNALSCVACLETARQAEAVRCLKRTERGDTCDACKKRPVVFRQGHNLTPTGAYKTEHLCETCARARIQADLDQAGEAFKRFRDAPAEPLGPDEETPQG
jgi:hypothetical protein